MGNRNVVARGFTKGRDHLNISRLTKKQLAIFNALTDPKMYGKTMGEVAEQAGVARNTCYYMLGQDWFLDMVNERVNTLIDKHLYELYQASFTQAKKPNGFQDRKMLFEMYGKYSQTVNVRDVTPAFIEDVEDDDDATD